MQKFLKALAKIVPSLALGTIGVVRYPKIAIGFMTARGTGAVKNAYAKILVGASLGVLAAFLVLNAAELAICGTAMAVADAFNQWIEYVDAA